MKNILLMTFSAMVLLAVYAFGTPEREDKVEPSEGIRFHVGSWESALQQARKEQKLIFLDVYATWCGPCKRLKSTTFTDTSVGDFYNQNFINVALDGEKGEGKKLMQQYGLTSYPSLLFIDADGKLVGKAVGYHSPQQMINLGQKVKK
jgi:thioredoxin 1